MVKTKEKLCKKGSGPAIGFIGCGNKAFYHRYSLCKQCYINFLYDTPSGEKVRQKAQIRAKTQVQKEAKKEWAQKKESGRSKSYYEKKLEFEINSIVRLIDQDKGCVSCTHGWDKPWTRQRHACHRHSVGSNASLRFNLINIHGGCSICNKWKSGNEREYDKGLIRIYGIAYLEEIKALPGKYPSIHLSQEELKEKIQIAREIKKEILDGKDFTREEINKALGIYK